jgi:hypothetical protein
LFFAISWGIVSNVIHRWKPFHYALCFKQGFFQATCRTFWSWLLLNILPWVGFAVVLVWLKYAAVDKWTYGSAGLLVLRTAPAGLIPFGAYHLWLSLIHAFPLRFYAETQAPTPYSDAEPNAACLGLPLSGRAQRRGIVGNLISGLIYLGFGLLARC